MVRMVILPSTDKLDFFLGIYDIVNVVDDTLHFQSSSHTFPVRPILNPAGGLNSLEHKSTTSDPIIPLLKPLQPLLILRRPLLNNRSRPLWHDPLRIDAGVALRITHLDVRKVRRLLEPLVLPVQELEVAIQDRVIMPYRAEIALEMLHVDGVEADQRGVQLEIDLGEMLAEQERLRGVGGEGVRGLLQGAEDDLDVGVVRLLVAGEAGLVHAQVQLWHEPGVDRVDLGAEGFRVEVEELEAVLRVVVVAGDVGVEGRVELPHDLFGLVVDDPFGLLVPEDRHGEGPVVVRSVFAVDLVEEV